LTKSAWFPRDGGIETSALGENAFALGSETAGLSSRGTVKVSAGENSITSHSRI
jgi:hypothetical protein